MKVLVTGVDGYIGAVLASFLLDRGIEVLGVDCGFYRDGWLYNDPRPRPHTLTQDIRQISPRELEGFDAVVHLAELSNDPLGEHDPGTTYDINYRGSVRLARAAKAAGVPRFVYASSCSVYGAADDGTERTEESDVRPQTAYAKCKVLVERNVAAIADSDFSPVFLRNATAFGVSPRMRFDTVLNNLAGLAWTTGKIQMTSDGMPWRPLVHVNDISEAIALSLEAPRERIHNETFNVGSNAQNYRIRDIADIVGRVFEGCEIRFDEGRDDNRSYRCSFNKIGGHLEGFACRWTAERGARQLQGVFRRIGLDKERFEFRAFTRLQQLKHLIEARQIDVDFYWRPLAEAAA